MKTDYSDCKFLDKYPGYAISPNGDVFHVRTGNSPKEVVKIKQANGRVKVSKIYRLVAEAFVSNPHGFRNVVFIDGNKRNTHPSNLRWQARSSGGTKLSEDEVRVIHALLSEGESYRAIARHFNVSAMTISAIDKGKIWKQTVSSLQ